MPFLIVFGKYSVGGSEITKKMENVFFLPWKGKDYETGGMFGKRIMALGASHYSPEPSDAKPEFTINYVRGYLREFENAQYDRAENTLLKFERSLVNKETGLNDRSKIWHSLLFYNYIQELLKNNKSKPTMAQCVRSEKPLFEVLNKYQPDCCIVWGKSLWYNLPRAGWSEPGAIVVEGKEHWVRKYHLDNGNKVPFLCVHHPAIAYSWDYWYRVIEAFLKTI